MFVFVFPIGTKSMKINILSSQESYAALITMLPAVKLMEANVA